MTEPIGSFEMINVMEASKNSESVGENELIENTSQYRVITMGKLNRSTSGIWSYFGIAEKQNAQPDELNHKTNDRILCLLCFEKGTVHVYNRSTSSGNLWRHLYRKHNIQIPKDRIYRTTINVKNNFDCNDTKFIEHDEGTIFSRDLDAYNISIDSEKLEIMTNETCKNEGNEIFKDIGGMLIAEVAKRPALFEWNPSFGKKIRRDTLWQEVYEALGKIVEVDRLQKMWKNIRDRYKKLRNLERNGLSDSNTRYKYYDQLRFLDYSEQQESQDAKTFDSSMDNSIDFETLVGTTEEPPEKRLHPNDEDEILHTFDLPKKEISTTPSSAFINIGLPIEKTCNMTNDTQSASSTVSSTELLHQNHLHHQQHPVQQQPQQNCSDEFDLFGRFIAEKLRKLPSSRIGEVEIKILQVIRSEENQ